ncbi:hypothetical protein Nepgr_033067 [Nepenthes gracilis]|uniref:AAA+ ATPase domain-containing protein n=1 Tax=Nepenthes gracilis TaxID=150966 RepID=A0AAD3TL80_NEPGR|nr:hypothetical protein Nepgr_033067 [Nepenthes gracilis]
MDIDIPDADELEWLEANSHLHDDEDCLLEEEDDRLDPYTSVDEQGQSPHFSHSPRSLPEYLSSNLCNYVGGNKRRRSDSLIQEPSGSGNKRISRSALLVAETGELEEDDDQRPQYLPPPFDSAVAGVEREEEKFLSLYASEIDGDCMPVTGPCGERVYAKINRVENDNTSVAQLKKLYTAPAQCTSRDLILEPIDTLFQRAEQGASVKALQATSKVQNSVLSETSIGNEELWVDKYAPKLFTELLSDEQTNREVLLWLKQWDSTVFGCDVRSTAEEVLSALRRHSSASYHQRRSDMGSLWKSKVSRSSEKYFGRSTQLDQVSIGPNGTQGLQRRMLSGTGSPQQKVLLLCGPPGLGKTTLAHVAAKHCGYRVVEINASDDRSSSTVEMRILDAVQMNSVMADSKPKCLVIDEIDGALGDGKGAVEIILQMISAERSSDTRAAKEEKLGNKSYKKRRKVASLSRPVICICNDLYAPVLRPLRQVAKVHIFAQPAVNRVVSRLKHICNKEGLRTSLITLTALAECTECDIRSCLNTLQFLYKNKEVLNVLDISSQIIGRKDTARNIFDIWKEIFRKRKIKRHRIRETSRTDMYDSPESLYSLVSNRGDYDLFFEGIHENILKLYYHDPLMRRTVKCLDTLGVSDLLHKYIMHSHHMPLYVYFPPIAVTIPHLLGRVEKPMIEWPKSFQRYRSLLMEKTEILRSWNAKIVPYISRHLSVKSFIEDTLSPLLYILSPATLRPVALHLLSEREKNDLAQLVSVMVSYSITYKNVISDRLTNNPRHEAMMDAASLSFDPSFEEFNYFEGYRPARYELTLAVKQVLAHEVEKQKILLGITGKLIHPNDSCNKENGCAVACAKYNNMERATDESQAVNPKCSTSKNPSTSGSGGDTAAVVKLKPPRAMQKPSNGAFNLFDRFKKLGGEGSQNAGSPMQKPATLQRDSRPLLFKFNEGFTNAVKRPVRVREFLFL